MRYSVLFAILVFALNFSIPQGAEAANRYRSMTVQLEDGRTVRLRVFRYHGVMMVMAPLASFGVSNRR